MTGRRSRIQRKRFGRDDVDEDDDVDRNDVDADEYDDDDDDDVDDLILSGCFSPDIEYFDISPEIMHEVVSLQQLPTISKREMTWPVKDAKVLTLQESRESN